MSYSSSSARSLYRQYSSAGTSSSENLPPRTLARVARELRNLHKNPPEGVRLIVDGDYNNSNSESSSSSSSSAFTTAGITTTNLEQVLCELQGPTETPYDGRFFVLKLVFTGEFPAAPPRGYFVTKLYHPNVDPQTGAICVNTLKKDWTAETTLGHVLAVIRCLLIVPFPESSLNDEAGKLFMESYQEYAKRAKLMAQVHGRTYNVLGNTAAQSDKGNDTDPQDQQQLQQRQEQQQDGKDEPLLAVHNTPNSSDSDDDPSHVTKTSSSSSSQHSLPHVDNTSGNSSLSSSNPLRSTDSNNKNKSNNKKIHTKSGHANGGSGGGGGSGSAKLSKKKSLKRL